MTGNHTMDYYVWPRHLYSHSRKCTRSGLCRRLSRLVASLICYLLDHANVHEISALVTWFQYTPDISSHYGDLDLLYLRPLWRSWSFVYLHHWDFDICILYVAMTTYVISCIMPIHGHCTLMYLGLLYVFAVICRDWLLYYTDGWMVLHHSTSGMDFIKHFGHDVTPLTSHIRGHLLQLILPHMVDHTFMFFPIPL